MLFTYFNIGSVPGRELTIRATGDHSSVVNVIKSFFGGNLDFPKIKKLNKVCSGD